MRPGPDPLDHAARALTEARAARARGHHEEHLEAARRALEAGIQPPELALIESVAALVFLARFDEAIVARDAMDRDRSPYHWFEGESWLAYGDILSGRLDSAHERLERVEASLADLPPLGDLPMFAAACRSRLEQARDRPIEALHYADLAASLAETFGPDAMDMAYFHLGHLWLEMGVSGRALRAFERALAIPGRSPARLAATRVGASLAEQANGEAASAEHHAREAIALYQQVDDTFGEGTARQTLAEALQAQGRDHEGAQEARRAVECFQAVRSSRSEMQARLCLAKVLLGTGDPAGSREQLVRIVEDAASDTLHGEAGLLLAEHHGFRWAGLVEAIARAPTKARPGLEARAARLRVEQLVLRGDARALSEALDAYAAACRVEGDVAARRSWRAVEVRDQMVAHQREEARAEALAQAVETQRTLREAAEIADQQRRDLLEVLAHDLRNPLSALRLLVDELEEARDLDEVTELARIGRRSLTAMLGVLDEALSASEAVGGVQPLALVDLAAVARDAVARAAASARGKEQLLHLAADEASPVRGVAPQLRSIVDNLLSNALKFTPRGGRVGIRVESLAEQVRLVVEDSGPGIGNVDPEDLFQRRRRGPARPTEGEPTSGLGLYLVRRLVRAHGGEVEAMSRDGGGSVFVVTLPHADPDRGLPH